MKYKYHMSYMSRTLHQWIWRKLEASLQNTFRQHKKHRKKINSVTWTF